jgi:hypothetical protein
MIRAKPCEHGAVDLSSTRMPPDDEVLHVTRDEWAQFLAEVKAGRFDHVSDRPPLRSAPPPE